MIVSIDVKSPEELCGPLARLGPHDMLDARKARRGERSQMADACAAAGCKDPIVCTRHPGNLASLDWCYFYLACHLFQAWRTWQACHRFPPRRPSLALGQPQVFQLLCPVCDHVEKDQRGFFKRSAGSSILCEGSK